MESSKSCIPIDETQLSRWNEPANALLAAVKWTPKDVKEMLRQSRASTSEFRESSVGAQIDKLSLVAIARAVSGDPVLLSEETNHVLSVVRAGLRIGMHLSHLYTKSSGLETLIEINSRGGLSEGQKTEFRAKYETASALTLFATAYYVCWTLNNYKTEQAGGVDLPFGGVPEVCLLNPVRSVDCMVYYYAAWLEKSGSVQTNAAFVKMTQLYFGAIIEEVKLRENSLKFTEPFTAHTYRLEGTEFCVNGFDAELMPAETSIEFNRVTLDQIVGNRDAKHKARRLAERLVCYDMTTRRNPMCDLGGLQTVRMGHGEPGTGKSMQIAATATLLCDYCRAIGLPFLFWPLPDTVVSTYQGGSAERMMGWMKPLRDPGRIIYAPVDDAENNLEERTRQGVSAGVREVIAVFLRNTEGAYAVHHGNAVIELFTNLPDQIDRAVLSRIMDRVYIGGAQTIEDFLDQDYLWWKSYEELVPGFIDMREPGGYRFLSEQTRVANLSQVYRDVSTPADEKVRAIFDRIGKRHKPAEHRFFALLFEQIRKEFPLFTSRDVRNIQQAVSARIMDFDLEPSWLDTPEVFFRKDYDTKRAMLVELMRANMKGLEFQEIRLQETVRYLDSMTRIFTAGRQRQLDELVAHLEIRRDAERRLRERTE